MIFDAEEWVVLQEKKNNISKDKNTENVYFDIMLSFNEMYQYHTQPHFYA